MNTLHLPIKKQWFDMILSGEKTEEYREIKPYWFARIWGKPIDVVEIRNGYGKSAPSAIFECKGICKGIGKPEWGAPDKIVYIISLGVRK